MSETRNDSIEKHLKGKRVMCIIVVVDVSNIIVVDKTGVPIRPAVWTIPSVCVSIAEMARDPVLVGTPVLSTTNFVK